MIHQSVIKVLSSKTIRKRSSSWLVDYSHNIEATNKTSLFGGSTLRVVEENRIGQTIDPHDISRFKPQEKGKGVNNITSRWKLKQAAKQDPRCSQVSPSYSQTHQILHVAFVSSANTSNIPFSSMEKQTLILTTPRGATGTVNPPFVIFAGKVVFLGTITEKDRHIKSTTTKIKDDNVSLVAEPFILVKTIRKCRSSWLVDYLHNVEASNNTSLFGGSTLRVVEESCNDLKWPKRNVILNLGVTKFPAD
ncbi:NAD-specific glutamate dehydrogenase [Senna tora]|uniref:NAD-specific glutamate dehydrogenase n=1 Tax=Senna tora TaxID=362788 RepID=A0A834SVM0_9FABA|nr:NAD-specific glutamate dehydrogenase [Senna tora]